MNCPHTITNENLKIKEPRSGNRLFGVGAIFIIFISFAGFLFFNNSFAQQQCQLTQVTWSSTAGVHIGESRTLTATGQGCNGLAVSFDIYELDPGLDDYLATVQANFSGNTAAATYTFTNADYVKGGNEFIGENVYFKAKVFDTSGNEIDSIESIDIVFLNTQAPGGGGGGTGTGGGGGGTGTGGGGGGTGQTQTVQFEIKNPITAQSLVDLAKAIGKFIFTIAIPIAVIVIIYAGILFLTSGGNKEKVTKARTALLYAVVGLAIILIGQGFFTLIKSILNLGGPTP